MILCVDSGNSRIKWGLGDDNGWLTGGVLEQGGASALAAVAGQAGITRAVFCNVAGPAAAAAIQSALAVLPCEEFHSQAAGGGVRNGYRQAQALGVDRWHALIGACGHHDGACLVVMAGTATTIDTLTADGQFAGGLILPGVDLMRRALARDTAALPLAEGAWSPAPGCTADAIVSGCLEAQAGAIERAYARLGEGAICLLSGGAADRLAPLLSIPVRRVGNLVLDGLLRRARDDG